MLSWVLFPPGDDHEGKIPSGATGRLAQQVGQA